VFSAAAMAVAACSLKVTPGIRQSYEISIAKRATVLPVTIPFDCCQARPRTLLEWLPGGTTYASTHIVRHSPRGPIADEVEQRPGRRRGRSGAWNFFNSYPTASKSPSSAISTDISIDFGVSPGPAGASPLHD
ncbi:hypothetical protein THAOC_29660, partial [Thalassiosira oceanica]